jgi:nucleotide-binding universal stress UspA family protein
MRRILVGVDGSPESKQAAEFAAQVSLAIKADLTLVYVAAPMLPLGPEPFWRDEAKWQVEEREYGDAVLREISARCAEKGRIDVETRVETGPVAETLAGLAGAGEVDFVAVGHRGRGRVQRALLGSVADRLVQISPRPVLVCRNGGAGHAS